jgi:hypothetical protein
MDDQLQQCVRGPYFTGANNGGTNYIGAEGAQIVPTQIGNTTSATCSAKTSMPPTISPTPAGTYSAPTLVTLTDAGYAAGAVGPLGNTSIYYTTDGTTPTTSSALYTAPFRLRPVLPSKRSECGEVARIPKAIRVVTDLYRARCKAPTVQDRLPAIGGDLSTQ